MLSLELFYLGESQQRSCPLWNHAVSFVALVWNFRSTRFPGGLLWISETLSTSRSNKSNSTPSAKAAVVYASDSKASVVDES